MQSSAISIKRFKHINQTIKDTIIEAFSKDHVAQSSYVIFTDAKDHKANPEYLVYNEPDAAFIVNGAPVTLCLRGDVRDLSGKGVYFIPSDKKGMLKRRQYNWAKAAVFLLCLLATFFFFKPGDEFDSLINGGYASLEEVPDEYKNEDILKKGKLVATNSNAVKEGIDPRMDHLAHYIITNVIRTRQFEDKDMITYLDHVLTGDNFSNNTKKSAMICLYGILDKCDISHKLVDRYRKDACELVMDIIDLYSEKPF